MIATLDPEKHLKTEHLISTFKYFDANDSNEIGYEDLKKVFLRAGKEVTDDELAQMYDELEIPVD